MISFDPTVSWMLVWVLVGASIGGVAWLVKLQYSNATLTKDVERHQDEIDNNRDRIGELERRLRVDMKEDLQHIEERLGRRIESVERIVQEAMNRIINALAPRRSVDE